MDTAVILLSGGMDSTIALYWALHEPSIKKIDALAIDYSQRHKNEVLAAGYVWHRSLSSDKKEKLNFIQTIVLPKGVLVGASSLLELSHPVSEYENVEEAKKHNTSDPSFIPARNSVFIALAANYLLTISPEGGLIVTGGRGRALGPGGGFADGSPEFADAMSTALSVGTFGVPTKIDDPRKVVVWDPLNRPGRSRKDALELAETLPGCWEALGWSMTCFQGKEPPCGKCLPCLRRAEGFKEFGKPDPLIERLKRTGQMA